MVFVFLLVWIFLPLVVFAQQTPSVVINEIAWMGTSAEGVNSKQHWRHEWLELFNTKDNPLQVDGWSVELYRGEEVYFTIPLQGSISGNGYFLVGASDKISNVDVNYSNLGGKFVNSGMKVVVQDNLGNIVDQVDAKEGWSAGENKSKRTMERIVGSDPTQWQSSAEPGGTPRKENSAGFQDVNGQDIFFANKKDLAGSLYKESLNIFSSSFPLALALALGSGALVLGLRRVLARQP